MPQGVAVFLITVGVNPVTAAAIASTLTAALVSTAIAYGVSQYTAKKAQEAYKNREVILQQNIRSTTQPHVAIYGKTAVGSMLSYANTLRVAGSADNFELWYVDTHAGHECEDISDIYYDTELLTDAAHIDWNNNRVDAGPYGITKSGEYAAKIWKRLGTSTQTVISELDSTFADIDSNFRGRGICYTAHRFTMFSTSKEMWNQRGAPTVRRPIIKGRKDIYDPRLDTSPGANPSSPTYQSWTDNAALCIANAMVHYGEIDNSRMDWSFISGQADICDALVPIPPATSPETTQKRYTINGAFTLGVPFAQTLEDMKRACLAQVYQANGLWRVRVGAYEAPSVTLTEDDIVGEVTEVTNVARRDRWNSVRGTFIDADEGYTERPYSPMSISALVTRDNGKTLWKEWPSTFVTSDYQAQRVAYKLALQSDDALTLNVPVRWTGLKVTPNTVVSLTFGPYSAKAFRCINWRLNPTDAEKPCELVLREENSASWVDPTVAEYTTRDAAGNVTPGVTGPAAVTSLTATAILGGVRVAWTNPDASGYDFVRVYASATSAWGGASMVYQGHASEFLHKITAQRWYWVVTVKNETESLRNPNSDTSTIQATPLTDAEPGATVGAPGTYPFVETFDDNDLTRVQSWWTEVIDTGGEESIVDESTTPALMGGDYVYQLGNNSGDDEVSRALDPFRAVPVEEGVLYRMSWHIRRSAGATNQIQCGVAGLTSDRTTWVNTAGANLLTSQHYCSASAHQPADTQWHTKIGYFMRTGATATGSEAPNPLAPLILHTNAHYVVPIFNANFDNQAGTYQIGYVDIERVGTPAGGSTVISDILTDTVVGEGQLADGTGIEDGTIYRQAAKGVAIGTAFDGDAVTFPQAWTTIPSVVFGSGGVTSGASQASDAGINLYRSSADRSITFGAEPTEAHGLGGLPDLFGGELICTTSQHGYSVGQRIAIGADSYGDYGISVFADSTNLGFHTDSSGVHINSRTTDAGAVITASSWKVRLWAIKFGTPSAPAQLTQSFTAENLSTTGFTARLRLKELVGSTTPRTDSTKSTPGSPSGVDQSINKGQSAEAWDDKYTFQLDVTVTNSYEPELGGYLPGQVQVGFYTNDGVGGWILRATETYYGSTLTATKTYTNVKKTLTVDGLGLDDDFGISILVDWFGGSTINFDQVDYETASAPADETATPSGSSPVSYTVVG